VSKKTKGRRPSNFRVSPTAFEGFSIAVANRQRRRPVDSTALKTAVACVLRGEGVAKADISIAVVTDRAIHDINRQFLDHDEPTDVITFVLGQSDGFIDGEIVVSADMAANSAPAIGWSQQEELLLYVIHGALHLTGYDDLKSSAKRRMRNRERHYLAAIGIKQPFSKSSTARSK
jgi:probable rRNA maturation factor